MYTKNHASGGTLCGKGKRCGPTGWYPMKWRRDWVRSVALRLARVITCFVWFNPFNYIINGITPSKTQCKTRGPENYYVRDLCVSPNDQRAESMAVTSKLLDHASWLDRWHSTFELDRDESMIESDLVSLWYHLYLPFMSRSCISSNNLFCPFLISPRFV